MNDLRPRILFVCSARGARALIAVRYAEHFGKGEVVVQSASFEPGVLSPLPREIMEERGLPIADRCERTVFEHHRDGERYDFVVALCQQSRWTECPTFQANVEGMYGKNAERIAWSVQDFAGLEGSEEDRHLAAQHICDQIQGDVRTFLDRLRRRSTR